MGKSIEKRSKYFAHDLLTLLLPDLLLLDSFDLRFDLYMCSTLTFRHSNLIRHMKIHTDERPYKCHLWNVLNMPQGNLLTITRANVIYRYNLVG